mgnify:CR=1 FL=1
MRIGFDARAIRYRGIGTYSRNLLLRFADTGIEFVVFCQDEEKGAIPSASTFTLVSANMDPLNPGGRRAFRSLVEKAGIDLLHVPSPWAPSPTPVPLVATIHDVTPLLYPRSVGFVSRLRYKRQLARTLEEASRIITVSQISYSALSAYSGVDPAKVRVIYNGVSEEFEALIADTVRDTVYEHLSRLRLIAGDPVPLDVRSLETVIVEGLGEFEAYGIVPAAEHTVGDFLTRRAASPAVDDEFATDALSAELLLTTEAGNPWRD